MEPPTRKAWAWDGTVRDFLAVSKADWIAALRNHHVALNNQQPSAAAAAAWEEEREALIGGLTGNEPSHGWGIVFEYELPLEGGRRPDVVVVNRDEIIVLEFKSVITPLQADLDQVAAYARDLSEYHSSSRGHSVTAVLVLPRSAQQPVDQNGTWAMGGSALGAWLAERGGTPPDEFETWLQGTYEPLPTLVAAARRLFSNERIPHVFRARAAGIPQAVDFLHGLAAEARGGGKRVLALLTGVPGSGKTLVGLRVVYEGQMAEADATFLSGNGPLVDVLQDALNSKVFVRDLHAFIKSFGLTAKVPPQHIIVFDEAQRAWDSDYMEAKKGVQFSEPDLLIKAASRIGGWTLLLGLVGEGQEIYSGEEAGLSQWRQAIENYGGDDWEIVCGPRIESEFRGISMQQNTLLDLDISLRSRTAQDLHEWVRHLLGGSVSLAAQLAARIIRREFPMYITRDLDQAREYARRRYLPEPGLFGLLTSSHSKSLSTLGLDIGFMRMRRFDVAKWFNGAASDPDSAMALTQPVTEFQCQGLELDLPIVIWGNDFLWNGQSWDVKPKRRKYQLDDPARLLENAYRVLLTRGRDGLVVVVPDGEIFDQTELALLAAGLIPLQLEAVSRAAEEPEPYRTNGG